MPAKVKLDLSNPWVDENGKVHDVGSTVSVAPDLAERLVSGGIGVPAKSDVDASGDAQPASTKK